MTWEVALVAVSTAVSVAGELQKGQAESRAAKFQAEQARQQAEQLELQAEEARLQGELDVAERGRELDELKGFNLALARTDAASSGSFLAIQSENERAAARDELIFMSNATGRRAAALSGAANQRTAILAARDAASSASRGGLFAAAGKAFSGGIRLKQLS
jgi:hypothetical protein